MVRVSDILRRMRDEGEESERKASQPPGERDKREPERGPERKPERPETPPSPPPGRPEVAFRKEIIPTTQLGIEAAESLYERLLGFAITQIFEKARGDLSLLDGRAVEEAVLSIMDRFRGGETTLLYIAATHATPDYYLHAHSVNTAIFVVWVGLGMGYSRERLVDLGIAAFLHDIGMTRLANLVQKPERLTPDEFRMVQEHTGFSVEMLKRVRNLSPLVLEVTQTVHERVNGQGYPNGLMGDAVSEESQCVAVCDVYEALTHPRNYREKFSPHEALKAMLQGREYFHPRVLKHFVEQMTIYPVGSWLELSTGEQGQVVQAAPKLPLRPTVKVAVDNQGKSLAAPRIIDLSQHAPLYVKRGLSGEGQSPSGGR